MLIQQQVKGIANIQTFLIIQIHLWEKQDFFRNILLYLQMVKNIKGYGCYV